MKRMQTTCTHRPFQRGAARGGISLMEILVSVFVLSIGLLGVIAALPIGGFAIQKAKIADRSAACGRAALAEIRVRGWMDPDRVRWYSGGTLAPEDALVYDPLLWDGSNATFRYFPYNETAGTGLPRCTVKTADLSKVLPKAVAERIFVWEDQLEHVEATEDETRPEMMMRQDTSGNDLCSTTKKEFSWMWTVTPRAWDSATGLPTSYEVSAVVFFRRDLDPETDPTLTDEALTERAVRCELVGGGIGGGDVRLECSRGINLDLENTDYILLFGDHAIDTDGDGTTETTTVCHWYRVAGYGEVEEASGTPGDWLAGAQRAVSLVGPDWRYGTTCTAVLATGVSGVYTTTVPADDDPLW